MMIVTLTRPESRDAGLHDRNSGPLRRLFEDMNHLNRRLGRMEEEMHMIKRSFNEAAASYPYEKYTMRAAAEMSAQIDQDVLAKLNAQQIIGSGLVKGLTKK